MYLVHFLGKLAGKASHEGNVSWLCLDAVLEAVGLFPWEQEAVGSVLVGLHRAI